jgi:membrane protein DedA with SNARE-associated domain
MRGFSAILWGLIFIALGAVMLFDRFGYLEFDLGEFLHIWWPLILVVVGLGLIFDRSHGRKEK